MTARVCHSCHATIRFVRLDTGRPIPVEPHPFPDRGSVAGKAVPGGELTGYVITGRRPLLDGYQRYVTHFAACAPGQVPAAPTPRPPSLFDPGAA